MFKIWSNNHCCDCGNLKKSSGISGSFQCETCLNKLVKRIKANSHEVQSPEKRLDFLIRMNKELNVNRTEAQIKEMVYKGFNDQQILTNKKIGIARVREPRVTAAYYL